MWSGIRFLVFVAIVTFIIFFQFCNFWTFAGLLIAILLAIIASTTLSMRVRSCLGWIGFEIGANNNFRLYTLLGLAVLFFLLGFKYGAGEPLMVSTLHETSEKSKSFFSPERQKSINRFFYGFNKANDQIENEINFLKSINVYNGDIRPKDRNWDDQKETDTTYNEKIRNWKVYKLFVNDASLNIWLKQMPPDFKAQEAAKEPKRTWIFWKLWIVFTFLSLFYVPFAYSDETAEILQGILDGFRRRRGEIKSVLAEPPASATGTSGEPAKTEPTKPSATFGKFGWLYTSDMAAEFTIRLLQALIKTFSTKSS